MGDKTYFLGMSWYRLVEGLVVDNSSDIALENFGIVYSVISVDIEPEDFDSLVVEKVLVDILKSWN